ncbi:MAG: cell division/cell wall cluster transcriptional repressor MraZ [Paludibacteraceae bacterium]|nr:cell division/cell wall cluster transcriptional repressor MraZ [Paludibacteraceae bacterium]
MQLNDFLSNTFLGQVQSKTDDKGRIFVPSSYRRVLKEMNSDRIIMRRDTDNECLIFYPEQVWNKKVNDLRAVLDEWNAEDQMILMQFMSDAEILETDAHGRVLITKQNLQLIGAKQDVLFVGMMDRFALWAPENYQQKNIGQKALADKIREKMQAAKNHNV